MIGKPLEFCAHLAKAIRNGRKIATWKPLSPADIVRRPGASSTIDAPWKVGSVSDVYEPWGYVGTDVVFASSFSADTFGGKGKEPASYRSMSGVRSGVRVKITGCALRKLSSITSEEARAAGMIPLDVASSYLDEFKRQWRASYKGAQAWEADPPCWVVSFRLAPA